MRSTLVALFLAFTATAAPPLPDIPDVECIDIGLNCGAADVAASSQGETINLGARAENCPNGVDWSFCMRAIPNNAPTNVAALDARDPNAGNASHEYGIQFGGPSDVVRIQFQHGPRGVESSTSGIFDDDLLAIIADRLEGFQSGPFACAENQDALDHIKSAREALGLRVARRINQGVLGANRTHST